MSSRRLQDQQMFAGKCQNKIPVSSKQVPNSLKNQTSKDAFKNKCIRFSLNLHLRSRSIDPSHFRKIKWLLVEHGIMNTNCKYWNGMIPGYIHEMFKLSPHHF